LSQDLFGKNEVQYLSEGKAFCIFHLKASFCVPGIPGDPYKVH